MSLVQVETVTFSRNTLGGCYPDDEILTDLLKLLARLLLPQELRLICFSTLCPWNTCSTAWCRNDPFPWRQQTWDKYTYLVLQLEQFNEVILLSKCHKLWLPVLHENFALIKALCSFCIKLVPTANTPAFINQLFFVRKKKTKKSSPTMKTYVVFKSFDSKYIRD